MSLPGLVVDIEARIDKLEKGLKKANVAQSKSASAMEKRAQQSADRLRNTYADAANGIGTSFGRLQSSVSSFVAGGGIGAIAGAGVVAGITAVGASVRGVTRSLAEMGDMAQRAGVGVEEFQQWKFVAEQNRIGVDQMVDGLKELSLRADEFIQTGSGPGAEAFARLGLGAQDLARQLQDPSELMLEIIGRMEGMDRAAQIRIADEVFGGAGGERFVELIDQGEAGIRETMNRARELGLVMDADVIARAEELDRKFGEITARVGNLFQRIVVGAVEIATVGDEVDSMITALERIDQLKGGDLIDPATVTGAGAQELENMAQAAEVADLAMEEAVNGAAALAEEMRGVSFDLLIAGSDEASAQIEGAAIELDGLIAAWRNNQVSAEEFQAQVAAVTGETSTLIGALGQVDGVGFAGVISRIGALGNALAAAASRARQLAAAVALGGAAPPDDERGGNTGSIFSDGASIATASGNAPRATSRPSVRPAMVDDYTAPPEGWNRSTTRPTSRPTDIDFSAGPMPTGGGGGGGSSSGGGGGGGGGAPQLSDHQRAVQGLKEELALADLEAAEFAAVLASGGSLADAQKIAEERAKLLTAAQESGLTVTPQLRAEIEGLAQAYVDAGNRADETADKLRDMEEAGKEGARTLSDMLYGIVSGSTTAKQALVGLLQQLLKVQMEKFFLNMAGSSTGGGILSGLGKLLSGGFSEGGFTGPGGKHQIAGAVHAGEYVMSAAAVRRLGVQNLEGLHQGALRGYSSGGLVTPPRLSAPRLDTGTSKGGQPITINSTVTVNAQGGDPKSNADLSRQVAKAVDASLKRTIDERLMQQMRPGALLSGGRR